MSPAVCLPLNDHMQASGCPSEDHVSASGRPSSSLGPVLALAVILASLFASGTSPVFMESRPMLNSYLFIQSDISLCISGKQSSLWMILYTVALLSTGAPSSGFRSMLNQ